MRQIPDDEEDEPLSGQAIQPRSRRFRPHETGYEQTDKARVLQRQAEQDILLTLQLQKFDTSSPEWKALANAFAEYGYAVFVGWLVSGSIYRMAATHGRGVYGINKVPEDLKLNVDEAHDLATDVVVTAIDKFRRKTLMQSDPAKQWRADGGASIKTYFVGRCLMEFPDAYEKWHRQEHQRPDQVTPTGELPRNDLPRSTQPETQTLLSTEVEQAFRGVEPLTQTMQRLSVSGYTYEEIAEMLTASGHPVTQAGVRSKLYRFHASVKGTRS